MSDPGGLKTMRLNYALGIAAATLTLMLVSFAISFANLFKRSPRNKASTPPNKKQRLSLTPSLTTENLNENSPNKISAVEKKAPEEEDESQEGNDSFTPAASPQTPKNPCANTLEREDESSVKDDSSTSTDLQSSTASDENNEGATAAEILANDLFEKKKDGAFKNISIDGIAYFFILLVHGKIPEIIACSNQFRDYTQICMTFEKIKEDSKMYDLFKEIKKIIDNFCKLNLDEEERRNAKNELIEKLETEAGKLEKTYILAGFAMAFKPVILTKQKPRGETDNSTDEYENIRKMARILISDQKGKNLETLVRDWNNKHIDNIFKTTFSDSRNFNDKKDEVLKEINDKIHKVKKEEAKEIREKEKKLKEENSSESTIV